MRRLLLLLLFLSLPLFSHDASGKPVTDLQLSDFSASGPKGTNIDRVWLVPPQTVSEEDPRTPMVVLYDAANATCAAVLFPGSQGAYPEDCSNPYPDLRIKWLRDFLGLVAKDRIPLTFLISTAEGVEVIYDPRTAAPEVLSAALLLTENPKATGPDPKVEEQAKRLRLLGSSPRINTFRFDSAGSQINSLTALANLLPQSDMRKLVIWLVSTVFIPHGTSDNPTWDSRARYEIMVEQLNAAHVSIYVDFFNRSAVGYKQLLPKSTGGVTLADGSIQNAARAALSDFGPSYMLAVTVPTPKDLDWIPVNIKVGRPGLMVRAAPGFYGLRQKKATKAHTAEP
jgi:hypothetical protein